LLQIIQDLGNLPGPVGRQFLKSGFDAGLARAGIGHGNLQKKPGSLPGFSSKLVQAAADAVS
jgi:hypothetical protein